MRVQDCNWMQLEEYLRGDDRIVLPVASTEQHAYLSLGTDSILAERVSVEAAEPLEVPVLPVLPYGITPRFAAYPGSPSLRVETFLTVVTDLLESLSGQGFRRILIVNGHGGNTPARSAAAQWGAKHADARVRYHDWWDSSRVMEVVRSIDPEGSHASWMENFPWTRLPGVELPAEPKPVTSSELHDPAEFRKVMGDGSFGGAYQHSDEDMLRVWQGGVEEVRERLGSVERQIDERDADGPREEQQGDCEQPEPEEHVAAALLAGRLSRHVPSLGLGLRDALGHAITASRAIARKRSAR
jgi:creatinine amidohydrolase